MSGSEDKFYSSSTWPSTSGEWLETLLGHRVRIRTHGDDTSGRLSIIEFIERPLSKPPPFTRHGFVEVFSVQQGVFRFQFMGKAGFDARAGDVITVPSWMPHTFWNRSREEARVLTICSPSGLERFFEESDRLISGHDKDPQFEGQFENQMAELRYQYGLEIVSAGPEE